MAADASSIQFWRIAAAAALIPAMAWRAQAADSPLREALFATASVAQETETAIYAAATDPPRRFTLDRSTNPPLLRFDGQDEVIALTVTPGPRGDEFFKTDTGDVLLRATALGGLILYTPQTRQGVPVALVSQSQPLPPLLTPKSAMKRRLETIAGELGRVIGRTVQMATPEGDDVASGVIVDAAERAAQGLAAARPALAADKPLLIRIGYAKAPQADWSAGALTVQIDPARGYAGRPSSAAVARAVQAGR